MMKRLPLIVLAVGALALGQAMAGEYHNGATLICSQCHTMHASLTHAYDGSTDSDVFGPYPQSWTPIDYLLKGGSENALCLTCHDGQSFAPDVYGAGTSSPANRAAGALNDWTGLVGAYQDWMGHSLNFVGVAPGGVDNFDGLKCTDCHHQHGYQGGDATTDVGGQLVDSAYRNLAAFGPFGAAKAISYVVSTTNDISKDVWVNNTLNSYDNEKILLNEPNNTDSGFATWCNECHVDFHGEANVGAGPTNFIRHPSSGVNIGAVGGGHSNLEDFADKAYRVRVMSEEDGGWGTQGTAGEVLSNTLTPTCVSCHKAHGNLRPFGLIYADGSGSVTGGVGEDGGGTDTTLCQQCHVQGG